MPEEGMIEKVREAVAASVKETGAQIEEPAGYSRPTVVKPIKEAKPKEATTDAPAAKEKAKGPKDDSAADTTAAVEPDAKAVPAKPEDEDFHVSEEELAAIDKDPTLKKLYRGFLKQFTQKTQGLSEKRKEAEQALEVVRRFQEDPDTMIRAAANARGIKLLEPTPVEKEPLDAVRETMVKQLGQEGADVLFPLVEGAVQAIVSKHVAPIQQTLTQNQRQAEQAALGAGIANWIAEAKEDGRDWNEEIEREMSGYITAKKIIPGEGADLDEFLEVLYNHVMTGRKAKQTTGESVKRLREAKAAAEPVKATRAAAKVEGITPTMNRKDATKLAVEEARRELGL